MKKLSNSIMSALLGVVALTSVLGLFGVSAESMPFLDALLNFFSIDSIGGVTLAVIAVGGGSAEVTETTKSGANEYAAVDGTTVVGANAPSTTRVEASYIDDDLNPKLVLIRPQDTPIDTFTRTIANNVKCESWEAGGWEIGTRATVDQVYSQASASATSIVVDNPEMWLPGDTFNIHGESSGADTGPMLDSSNKPVAGLVQEVNIGTKTLTVKRIGDLTAAFPQIAADSFLYRTSSAVSELEASVEGFALQPSSRKYYNQTHMCQVEESVVHSLLKKKVPMDFAVYKEQTLWDFKRGMELSNIFGNGGLAKNKKGELVHVATGLWHQMDRQSTINYSTAMDDQDWNALGKAIFEGNNGADRRLLFAGSTLLEQIANVSSYQKQLEAKNTEMVLGLRVFKIETPFGELLIKPMGSLFEGYFSKCGMVIDPNFVKKYIMEPLTSTPLDLNKTGQRRVDNAVRIHETYSLFLENLPCHRKIVPA